MDEKDDRSEETTAPEAETSSPSPAEGSAPEAPGPEAEDARPSDEAPAEGAPGTEAPAVDAAGPPADLADEIEDGSVLPSREVRAIVEALIFALPQPITPREIGRVLVGVSKEDWQRALEELRADYARDERGLQLLEVAGGWQITTRPEYNDWVRELIDPRTPTRLSIQALETLAVIAYRQPVSRSQVSSIRGVHVDAVVRTLQSRGLIDQGGEDPLTGAALYVTTDMFLERMGLRDITELPPIVELLPEPDEVADHVDGEALQLP